MKKIIIFAVSLITATILFAQTVSETPIQIGDITTPAYTVKLDKDESLVADALKQMLKDNKLKTTKSKGFQVALAQTFTAIAPTPINFYSKTAANAASTLADIEKDVKKTEEKMTNCQKEIDKLNAKLAEYNKEMETMKANMEKYTAQKADAEKKVEESTAAVQAIQERINTLQQKLK